MHFPPVGNGAEPPLQRHRAEEPSAEEEAVKARLHNSWPQLRMTEDAAGPMVSTSFLHSLLLDHDRAHEHCLSERWTVRSRFGAHDRFGLSATFRSIAVVSDVDPPKENSLLTHVYVVNWSITDHEREKYYRFGGSDERAPALLSMLIAKKMIRDQPAMMQAVLEQLNRGSLVLPDQLLDGPASTRLTELDVQFGKNSLKSTLTTAEQHGQKWRFPVYTLHLEGVSSEHEEKDSSEEVRAVVELTFRPRSIPPALGGARGVVYNGNWEEDEFAYGLYHTRLLSGSVRLSRASDGLELVRDLQVRRAAVWMEHSFGGVVPRTVEEARFVHALRRRRIAEGDERTVHDHCLLRLFDEETHCLSLTRVMDGGAGIAQRCYATVQSATRKTAFEYSSGVSMKDEADDSYLSRETGIVYPTRWSVQCPTHDGDRLELQLSATLASQEMITCLAQPSVWEGTVRVTGKLLRADGKVSEVQGDGFVTSRGRGKQQAEKAIFGMLRGIGVSAMERLAVGSMDSWQAIADGPALEAVADVKAALQTQQFELTPSQQVILTALFGTYGFIFHHPQEVQQVKQALEWCYSQWMTFYGAGAINYRTLTIRAFVMQELCDLMHAKCAAWILPQAQALDIAVPVAYLSNSDVADSAVFTLPARALLLQPPSALELAQIKALMDGTWIMDSEKTQGSMNSVLIEQGVSVLWRSVNSNAVPTWMVSVHREKSKVVIKEVSMLEHRRFQIYLTGEEWAWESISRGPVKSRACVLANERELYVETEVRDGIERVWYRFHDGGKTMVQNIFYFPTPTTSKPVASCQRYFRIQLPLGSPTTVSKG